MIKVFTAFSGYDAPLLALKRYGVAYELVGYSEIDDKAIIAHKALHGGGFNYGSIINIDPKKLPDFDLFTYSFPCITISVAGLRKGMEEGSNTESSLLWESRKIIHEKRPKYLMMENVKNLVGRNFKKYFDMWLDELRDLGYNNYWKMINSKHCGVPHNRERIFCVSILKEHDNFGFQFYDDFDSGIRLKDILEPEVDEKYYLSEKKTKALIESLEVSGYSGYRMNFECDGNSYCIESNYAKGTSPGDVGKSRRTHVIEKVGIDKSLKNTTSIDFANCITARENRGVSNRGSEGTAILEKNEINVVGEVDIKGHEQIRSVYDTKGISATVPTGKSGNSIPKIVETCAERGRNPKNPKSRKSGLPTKQMLEISDNPDIMNCITTVQKDTMVLEKIKYRIRIRKLTPREVFRLMGLLDSEIDKIMATGLKDTHLYRLGGNSIVVNAMKFLDQLK